VGRTAIRIEEENLSARGRRVSFRLQNINADLPRIWLMKITDCIRAIEIAPVRLPQRLAHQRAANPCGCHPFHLDFSPGDQGGKPSDDDYIDGIGSKPAARDSGLLAVWV